MFLHAITGVCTPVCLFASRISVEAVTPPSEELRTDLSLTVVLVVLRPVEDSERIGVSELIVTPVIGERGILPGVAPPGLGFLRASTQPFRMG